ncbi:hypothetical protein IMZ48_12120 [Candidatus Bathyarchaeota archaeon]|nr:hypothetical protein [Candidatus Bathyarchaeota archaeon]
MVNSFGMLVQWAICFHSTVGFYLEKKRSTVLPISISPLADLFVFPL